MIVSSLSLATFMLLFQGSSAFQINNNTPMARIVSTNSQIGLSSSSLFAATTLDGGSISSGNSGVSLPPPLSTQQNSAKKEDDVKVGVLLLNLGGPEKTDDVEGELQHL